MNADAPIRRIVARRAVTAIRAAAESAVATERILPRLVILTVHVEAAISFPYRHGTPITGRGCTASGI